MVGEMRLGWQDRAGLGVGLHGRGLRRGRRGDMGSSGWAVIGEGGWKGRGGGIAVGGSSQASGGRDGALGLVEGVFLIERRIRRIDEHGGGMFLLGGLLGEFLGGDFLCGEEAAARAAGTAHRMLVSRLVEIRLDKR